MKQLLVLIAVASATGCLAQNKLSKLTFDDCENAKVFRGISNNTRVLEYIAADGSNLKLGDTLIIGIPSGTTTSTEAIGVGDNVGVAAANSQTDKSFSTIMMGKPGSFGRIISSPNNNAGAKMQGEKVVISEMAVFHKGSRKKPLKVIMLLGEPNGRAFGINKYMSTEDYEKSVTAGEIRSLNAPMTKEEAIKKLKESKDLLDLGVISQEEYDKKKEELTPVIIEQKK